MAMRYGYFDSEITGVDSEGMPIFDRAETSELFRLLFSKLLACWPSLPTASKSWQATPA